MGHKVNPVALRAGPDREPGRRSVPEGRHAAAEIRRADQHVGVAVVVDVARVRHLPNDGHSVTIGGVRFELHP